MLKVFNTDAISRNSRFLRGLVAGSITALVLAIVYGLLSSIIIVEFSNAFIRIGYCIGMAIQRFGRGVKIEFSIMGAVLTLVSIVLADLIRYFGVSTVLTFSVNTEMILFYLRSILKTDIRPLLSLAFRVGGIYAGYIYSRIV